MSMEKRLVEKARRWLGGEPGPTALVAHRCDDHRNLAPINNLGSMLVIYAAERRPQALAIGKGANGEEIHAECGGCLADDIDALYQAYLDALDLVADTLKSRAEMRRDLERFRKFM
jgi:hypothetical protein